MSNDLKKRKIAHEFQFFDTNRDGVLSWDDFERAASALAELMGWSPGSQERTALIKQRRTIWEELCTAADFDENDSVDLDEYQSFYARMTQDMGSAPEDASPWFRRVSAAHIESIDLDGRGEIDLASYTRFVTAHGASFDAEACFERLDLDGNGVVDKDEAVLLSLQFYLSDDPDVPGTWIWGPLDP